MEAYTVSQDRTTLDRKAARARARRKRNTERKEALAILNAMRELRIRNMLPEAKKSRPVKTSDGSIRSYKVGENVAKMACRLLYWEGKGALEGGWVYKSAREWRGETGLNERQQRVARRTAVEEGLWKEKEHTRGDGRTVVKYRLDAWRMLEMTTHSGLESARRDLAEENNATERKRLRRELRRLEEWAELLAVVDPPEEPEPATLDAGSRDAGNVRRTDAEKLSHQHRYGDCGESAPEAPRQLCQGYPDTLAVPQGGTSGGFASSDHFAWSAETVASPSSTPSAHGSSEPESPDPEAGMKLFRQVEAVVRGDCESAAAREEVGPLVERCLRGGMGAIRPAVLAAVVGRYVSTGLPDAGARVRVMVEEVLEEMREEGGHDG